MKTTQVERQVEWTRDPAQLSRIVDGKFCLNAVLRDFLSGQLDGARGEIHAGDLPAGFGEGNDVRTRAATEINGAAGRMGLDEFEEFGGTDTCIPGRLAVIPVMKGQAAEQVLHLVGTTRR